MPTARGEYGPIVSGYEKIVPIQSQILIRRDEDQSKTKGGLDLSDSAAIKSNKATVLAVGPGRVDSKGRLHPTGLCEGDRVLITAAGGNSVYVDQPDGTYEELFMVTEQQIIARL